MEFTVKSVVPEKQRSGCTIIGIFEAKKLAPTAAALDKLTKGAVLAPLKDGDLAGAVGDTLMLHNVPGTLSDRLLLVGCGRERDLDDAAFRKIVQSAANGLKVSGSRDALNCLTELTIKGRDMHWKAREIVQITHDVLYRFDELKSEKNKKQMGPRRMTLYAPRRTDVAKGERGIREGDAIAAGVALAKRLGNLPGNICTPSYLAEQAKALAGRHRNLKTRIVEEKDMEKLGMGALLSVARGSRQPAKLITLEYIGGAKGDKPVVLVGKGITFDSGGISIKPAAAMDEMKFDMCGAASVLGALSAVADLALPLNVVGLIPSCENLPDGNANKPGDVVTSMSGQTIEVLNTDAEGRLILCDALSYADRFNPTAVIDIATLTGACVIALGKHASGLFCNHPPLAQAVLEAGDVTGDRAWQLPLWEDYQEQLKSNFADMANIGGREAGAITAGCFLSRFTKKYHWAHLDIAGTAWNTGAEKGATGRPVPLLTQYLIDRTPKKHRA